MRRPDPRNRMDRAETIDFNDLSGFLRITQPELAKLIATPTFPKPIDSARRGIWKRSDIQAWLDRARARQQMTPPTHNGPAAA